MPTNTDYVLGVILKKEMALKSDKIAEKVEELIENHLKRSPENELTGTQINRFIGIAHSSDNRKNLQKFIEHQAVKEKEKKSNKKPWTTMGLHKNILDMIKEIAETDSEEVFANALNEAKDSMGNMAEEFGCLFSWDKVLGMDNEKLRGFLMDGFDIGWAKHAEIRKSEDGKRIHVLKDENSAEIIINEGRQKATLIIDNKKACVLKVEKENNERNIYKWDKAEKREKLVQDIAIELLKRFATHFGIHYLYRVNVGN